MVQNGYETPNDPQRVLVQSHNLTAQHEAETVGTVRAGHLVEETANGVQPLSVDGERPDRLLIALDLPGRGYQHGDAFPVGETIEYAELAGGQVRGLLAVGENVSLTDDLTSAGDGTVRAANTGSTSGEGVAFQVPADEPVNKSYGVDNTGAADAALLNMEVTH